MRTRSSDKRITRSQISLKKEVKRSSLNIRTFQGPAATGALRKKTNQSLCSVNNSFTKSPLSESKHLRMSVRRSANRSGSKLTPSKTKKTDLANPLDSSVVSSKSLKRTCLSPNSTPKHSSSKRRKITKDSIELERDPYELSGDENGSPILFPTTADITVPSAKPVICETTGAKKRKFFITRTPEISKRPNVSSLELRQRKRKTVTKRVPKLMPSRPRSQPLTDDERARIAATTIWLPIPNQQKPQDNQANVPSLPSTSQPQPLQQPTSSTLHQILTTSLPPIEENNDFPEFASGLGNDGICTGKPSIQISNLTPYRTSPSVSEAPMSGPCSTPLNKLTGKPRIRTSGNEGFVQPFSDVSNVLVSSVKRRTIAESEIKDQQEVRRISFAQPLSPIPKRSSNSRGSSGQSASGLKIPRRNRSQDEDQSNYEEWLKEFSSQLKPYEDFDLTID
nr:conserved hypothetical protein [Hymenolepis microstoma]